MKNRTSFKYTILLSILLSFVAITDLISQEQYALTEEENINSNLISQRLSYWNIGADDAIHTAIRQKWEKPPNMIYYIEYCEFEDIKLAMQGTSHMANSASVPFLYGSPNGEIIGDNSWCSINGTAICFQKDKYGVKIFSVDGAEVGISEELLKLTKRVLDRISQHDPKTKRLTEISSQNLNPNLQFSVDQVISFLGENGFVPYKEEKTTWYTKDDSIIGLRTLMKKQQSIFTVDLVNLSSDLLAQNTSVIRGLFVDIPTFSFENGNSITIADDLIDKWDQLGTIKHFSFTGSIEELSLQLYYFNPEGIDKILIQQFISIF